VGATSVGAADGTCVLQVRSTGRRWRLGARRPNGVADTHLCVADPAVAPRQSLGLGSPESSDEETDEIFGTADEHERVDAVVALGGQGALHG